MKLPDGSTGGTLVDQLGTVKAWRLRCSTTSLSFSYTTDNSTVHTLSRTISFSLNTWYHIACVRYGTVLRFFVDGMQLGEEFSVGSDVIYDSSVSLFIGAGHNSGDDSPEEFFSGRLDEVRICKGIARWTSSFVLPFIEYTYFDTNWVNTGTSSGITLPVGTVLSVFDDDVPDSYLECDGSVLSRMTYAALFAVIGTMYGNTSGSDFKLPDYRGCFLRGWDHSAGNDPDAADRTDRGDGTEGDYVGTRQEDQFRRHTHLDYATDNSQGNCALHSWTPFQLTYPSLNESSYGGNETRPLNIYCMYCIKYTT
jgi:microcystin-dependent protein